MLNELLLLSGNDIPFPVAQLVIHQPTISEIAYIGEEKFYTGCELLRFSKDNLTDEDKIHLINQTNFEILMSILNEKNPITQQHRICVIELMSLMFPEYTIHLSIDGFHFKKDNEEKNYIINKDNYDSFLEIVNEMFALNKEQSDKFNPQGELAKKIADKLKKGRQKVAAAEGNHKVAILSRYISILTVGLQKDMNTFMQYTVYQLFDEFKRYELKINHDIYLQAKLAGAQDLKEVDDWMKDIHP